MTDKLAQNETSASLHPLFGIPLDKMPKHVAIIMDGNGRWAKERGLPRVEGHQNGSKGVRSVITESVRLGFECLSLYSFSTENWKRPQDEVEALMDLYAQYLINERPTIMENQVRVRHLGQKEALPERVRVALDETIEMSKNNTGMVLFLALNYSGRSEIVSAVQALTQKVQSGQLDPDAINETLFSDHLDTAGFPDPDLLIRTSGEMRISNFLLWQIAYAEIFVTQVHWPDFNEAVLSQAVQEYAHRNRRYGGL